MNFKYLDWTVLEISRSQEIVLGRTDLVITTKRFICSFQHTCNLCTKFQVSRSHRSLVPLGHTVIPFWRYRVNKKWFRADKRTNGSAPNISYVQFALLLFPFLRYTVNRNWRTNAQNYRFFFIVCLNRIRYRLDYWRAFIQGVQTIF